MLSILSEMKNAALAAALVGLIALVRVDGEVCRDRKLNVRLYGEVGTVTFRCCAHPNLTEICTLTTMKEESQRGF